MKKILLLGFFLLFFSIVVQAYTIQGNCVIQEDAVSKIVVCPYSAWNPTGKDFQQTFWLKNKTSSDQNIFVAYKFDNQLVAGKVEYWQPAVYSWVQIPHQCAPPNQYVADMNKWSGQQNPNELYCFFHHAPDNNHVQDYNISIFDVNFNTYNLPIYTVYTDVNRLVAGNNYVDVTTAFTEFNWLNDAYYYTSNKILIAAKSTMQWRLTYTPNPLDTRTKWEMAFYQGTDAGCLISGTCSYTSWLDPWYDKNFSKRRPINIAVTPTPIIAGETLNIIDVNTAGFECGGDNNKFAIVWHNNGTTTALNAVITGGTCGNGDMNFDINAQFDIPANTTFNSSDNNGYYFYTTPNTVLSPLRDCTKVYPICSDFEDGTLGIWALSNSGGLVQADGNAHSGTYVLVFGGGSHAQVSVNIPVNYLSYWAYTSDATNDNAQGTIGDADPATVRSYTMLTGAQIYHAATGGAGIVMHAAQNKSWYNLVQKYNFNATDSNAFVYDINKVLIGKDLSNTTTSFSPAYVIMSEDGGGGVVSFIDDIVAYRRVETAPVYSIGAGQDITTIDVNLLTPLGKQYLGPQNGNLDGNHSIDFNIVSSGTDLRLQLYLSSSQFGFQHPLFDFNLMAIGGNPTTDFNCGASSVDFSSRRTCHVDWNILNPFFGDGNFFVDLNISNGVDWNVFVASQSSFYIDTNKPTVSSDLNVFSWHVTDVNLHLSCADSAGCDLSKLFYSSDSDPTSSVNLVTGLVFDSNILFSVDGNYLVDFNALDLAGNQSDLNSIYVLVDKNAPYLYKISPIADTLQNNKDFNWVFGVLDGNGSYAQDCSYWAFLDDVAIPSLQNQPGTINSDKNQCTVSFNYALVADGQKINVDVNIHDFSGNASNTIFSNYIGYSAPVVPPTPPAPPTGGGGGGGGTQTLVVGEIQLDLKQIDIPVIYFPFDSPRKEFVVNVHSTAKLKSCTPALDGNIFSCVLNADGYGFQAKATFSNDRNWYSYVSNQFEIISEENRKSTIPVTFRVYNVGFYLPADWLAGIKSDDVGLAQWIVKVENGSVIGIRLWYWAVIIILAAAIFMLKVIFGKKEIVHHS